MLPGISPGSIVLVRGERDPAEDLNPAACVG